MSLPGFTADAVPPYTAGRHLAMRTSAERPAQDSVLPQQPPPPAGGCYFAGTNCYGFIQTLKFCCGDGTEYTQRWGWCFGLWQAPPCLPNRY